MKQHNSEPAAAPRGDAWSADDLHILWELLGNGSYTNVYHPNFAVKFSTFVEDYINAAGPGAMSDFVQSFDADSQGQLLQQSIELPERFVTTVVRRWSSNPISTTTARAAAAYNPFLPAELLTLLAEDDASRWQTVHALASNPALPAAAVEALLARVEETFRKGDILVWGRWGKMPAARVAFDAACSLAANSAVADKHLIRLITMLADAKRQDVRKYGVLDSAAENPSASPRLLDFVAQQGGWEVASKIITHRQTSAATFDYLYPKYWEILADFWAAAANLPESLEEELLTNWKLWRAMSKNECLRPAALVTLSQSHDCEVLSNLSDNIAAPVEVLVRIAQYRTVAEKLVLRPRLPETVLRKLEKTNWDTVQQIARVRLDFGDDTETDDAYISQSGEHARRNLSRWPDVSPKILENMLPPETCTETADREQAQNWDIIGNLLANKSCPDTALWRFVAAAKTQWWENDAKKQLWTRIHKPYLIFADGNTAQ